jgi:regulator of PEP synthase PpsR (kinase-PPPase family)
MYKIYAVSDSIGETSELVAKATASQFRGGIDVERVPYLRTCKSVDDFIEGIEEPHQSMVISTIITVDVRKYMLERCIEKNIHVINILGPCINMAAQLMNVEAENKPGLIWGIDSAYYKKIEAMEFAMQYDDSKDHSGIKHADVVLIGLSRTSKTPICMALANKGIKAINIPLMPEIPVPEELFHIDKKKIVGLTIDPLILMDIRKNRLTKIARSSPHFKELQYANAERILMELEFADKLMRRLRCQVIDVTNRAIEDTALLIMEKLGYVKSK